MSNAFKTDVIIIGGGVLGTFHAYHALLLGKSVRLFEKNQLPQGATVRNFGQVVPSGLSTAWQQYGRRSLEIYNYLQMQTDLTISKNGSIYVASNDEELQLLTELHEINRQQSYLSALVSKESCLKKYPNLKSTYCKGGLFFPKEVSVDPRQMIHRLHRYLESTFSNYATHFDTPVLNIVSSGSGCQVVTNRSNLYQAEQVIVCNGSEFKLLYPELFAQSEIEVTKLQMLATVPQPSLQMRGNILTELSIRRYESFRECPSYTAIKQLENPDSFWKKWGVHLLFKQSADGSVIIGDSHEYATANQSDKLGFDLNQTINRYLLESAHEILELEDWTIDQQWFGVYSQCFSGGIFQRTLDDCIHIITGIGGKGMTVSPGFAESSIQRIFN